MGELNNILNDSLYPKDTFFKDKKTAKAHFDSLLKMDSGTVLFDFFDKDPKAYHESFLFDDVENNRNFSVTHNFYKLKETFSRKVKKNEDTFVDLISEGDRVDGILNKKAVELKNIFGGLINYDIDPNILSDSNIFEDENRLFVKNDGDGILYANYKKFLPEKNIFVSQDSCGIEKEAFKGLIKQLIKDKIEKQNNFLTSQNQASVPILSDSEIENYYMDKLFTKGSEKLTITRRIDISKNIENGPHSVFFFYNRGLSLEGTDYLWVFLPFGMNCFLGEEEFKDGYANNDKDAYRFDLYCFPLKYYDKLLDRYLPVSISAMLNGADIKDIKMTPNGKCLFILSTDGKVYSVGNIDTSSQTDPEGNIIPNSNNGILGHTDSQKSYFQDMDCQISFPHPIDKMVITAYNGYFLSKKTNTLYFTGRMYPTGIESYTFDNNEQVSINGVIDGKSFNPFFEYPIFKERTDKKIRISNICNTSHSDNLNNGTLLIETETQEKDYSKLFEYYILDPNFKNNAIVENLISFNGIVNNNVATRYSNQISRGGIDNFKNKEYSLYYDFITKEMGISRKPCKIYYKFTASYYKRDEDGKIIKGFMDEPILIKEDLWVDLLRFANYNFVDIETAINILKNESFDKRSVYIPFIIKDLYNTLPRVEYTNKYGKKYQITQGDGIFTANFEERICKSIYIDNYSDLIEISHCKVTLSPKYYNDPYGIQKIEGYYVENVENPPADATNAALYEFKDMKLTLDLTKVSKLEKLYNEKVEIIDDFRNTLVAINGRFTPYYIRKKENNEKILECYIMNGFKHVQSGIAFLTEKSKIGDMRYYKFKDFDIKLYKWKNIDISKYIVPSTIYGEDIQLPIDEKYYESMKQFVNTNGTISFKIPHTILMDEPFDKQNCLLFINGSVCDDRHFIVDPTNKRKIIFKNMKEFAIATIESYRLKYMNDYRTQRKSGKFFLDAINALRAMDFKFIRLSNSTRKVKLFYDTNVRVNYPYDGETQFLNDMSVTDLITVNGLAKSFEFMDLNTIKYHKEKFIPSIDYFGVNPDELIFYSKGEKITKDGYYKYLQNFWKFDTNKKPVYIATFSDVKKHYTEINFSKAEVVYPLLEKRIVDDRLYYGQNEVTRIVPLLF